MGMQGVPVTCGRSGQGVVKFARAFLLGVGVGMGMVQSSELSAAIACRAVR